MDIVDRGQELEQMHRDIALKRRAPKSQPVSGCSHCIDCGYEIPKARLQVMPTATHCFDCQLIQERAR